MEDKTIEELMSELSDGSITTTFSSSEEPLVVDMSDMPFPEIVSTVSQSPIGEQKDAMQEVQEMIEEQHSDFYNQNIEKDMDVLEKEYVNMERKAAIAQAKIIRFKQDHKDIFDKLAELEKEQADALIPKEDYREVIAHKLATLGEKKWKGMEVEFSYFAPSFKNTFNKKKFEAEQPKMYAKYVEKTPVKEYIKTKLSLLPILPEDIKEETNGNENIG